MTSNWDSLWSGYRHGSAGTWLSTAIHHAIVFGAYRRLLEGTGISAPDALEIGCGTGGLAACILQKYGGSATLMDSSRPALDLARQVFDSHGLPGKFIHADMFTFKPSRKYDLVHSEGLIEHFVGPERRAAIAAHRQCAKPGGYVMICVPRPVWYYRIARNYMERTGSWPYGFENPFDCKELKAELERSGLTVLKSFNGFRFAFALAKV